jgi:hypothetical protein
MKSLRIIVLLWDRPQIVAANKSDVLLMKKFLKDLRKKLTKWDIHRYLRYQLQQEKV